MAWVKVPKQNHPLFAAALPSDPRVKTINMFGAIAAAKKATAKKPAKKQATKAGAKKSRR
jgi:hypothetical protein